MRFKRVFASVLTAGLLAATCFSTTANAAGLKDVFDAQYYADKYPDLKAAFGYNEDMLYQHFLDYGLKEERNMSPIIDIQKYRSKYEDLNKAFGDNWDMYVQHFFEYGVKENRDNGTDFNVKAYVEEYADIAAATGGDYLAAAKHYMVFGINEDRELASNTYIENVKLEEEEAAKSAEEETTKPAEEETTKPENDNTGSGTVSGGDAAGGNTGDSSSDSSSDSNADSEDKIPTTGSYEEKIYYEDGTTLKTVNYYEDGVLMQRKIYDESGAETGDYTYEYRNKKKGILSKVTTVYAARDVVMVSEYDSSGRPAKVSSYNGVENRVLQSVSEYDSNMKVIKKTFYFYSLGEIVRTSVEEYDANGDKTVTVYDASGNVVSTS